MKIPRLYRNPSLALEIIKDLSSYPGIVTAQANPLTGKVLVLFQEEAISFQKLKEILSSRQIDRKINSESLWNLLKKEGEVFNQGLTVVFSGGLLAYLLVKQMIFGNSRLSQTALMANLSTATTIVTAYPIFRSGLKHLTIKGKINYEFLLTTITLASLFFKENTLGLLVVWLVNLTTFFQTLVMKRSERAINGLLKEKKIKGWILVNGTEVSVTLGDIKPGDRVIVHSGERILVDGPVLQGKAIVNQGLLNGKLEPVLKKDGDWVLAGSVVEEGSIQILAQVVEKDKQLSSLEEMVGEKNLLPDPNIVFNPMDQVTNQYSRKLMMMSLGMGALTYLLTRDLAKAATVLVIGSPSPASLALPIAMGAAVGNAAKNGVLIKNVEKMENLMAIDTIYFDKTGTLTLGEPRVKKVVVLDNRFSEKDILSLAAGCECSNIHPLARGIIKYAREKKTTIAKVENIQVVVGYGVRGVIEGKDVFLGSKDYMQSNDILIVWYLEEEARLKDQGLTVVWLALGDRIIGVLGLEDILRPEAYTAIQGLKELRMEKMALITGDNEKVAEEIGKELQLSPILSNQLPEEKMLTILQEKNRGKIVAMVGDGFNDCPALAKADIGITVGTAGTDLALESADIILVEDDLRKIEETIQLSKVTTRIVQQNFLLSATINTLGLFLALRGVLTPGLASIINNLSTLGIVINSGGIFQRRGRETDEKIHRGRL